MSSVLCEELIFRRNCWNMDFTRFM